MRPNRITSRRRPSSTRHSRSRALSAGAATLLAAAALWLPCAASAGSVGGGLPATFWKGTADGTWTGANWASDAAGTPTTAMPTAADDVTFSISSGATHQTTTLGQNFTIHSLTINDPMPVTISAGASGPFSLTISGATGTGINVQAGAGLVNIGGLTTGLHIVSGGPPPPITNYMTSVTLAGASDTITVDNASGLSLTAPLAGSNGLKKEGGGTLTLQGTSTYTGGTTVNAGTLAIDNNGTTTHGTLGSGPVVVNGATFTSPAAGTVKFLGLASAGSANFTVNGANGVTVTTPPPILGGSVEFADRSTAGSATFTLVRGNTGFQGGPILFSDNSSAGSATFNINGGSVQFSGNSTAENATFNVRDGGLQFKGAATGTTGAVSLESIGFFDISQSDAGVSIGSLSGHDLGYYVALGSKNLTIGSNNQSTTFSGSITGSGGLTKVGTGTLTLSGSNRYGTTIVDGGTLMAGDFMAFGTRSPVIVNNGGTLDIGVGVGIGSLSGEAGGTVQSTSPNRQITLGLLGTGPSLTANFRGTIKDSVSGRLSLDVNFLTQIFSGTNSYTGGTSIRFGTLVAGSAKALGSGDLTLNGGSTLRTTGGPLAVDIGAGNILFRGGLFQAQVGGTTPGVTHDQLKTTGAADISGGTLSLVPLNGYHLAGTDKVALVSAQGGVAGGTAAGTPLPASKVTGLAAFSNSPLLIPIVNLYETSVVLELMQGSFMALARTLAFSPNQSAVAETLDDLIARSDGKPGTYPEVDFFDSLPPGTIGANLDLLTPAALTSIFNLSAALANVQTANIQSRLADIRAAAGDVVPVNSVNVSVGSGRNDGKGARTKVAELAPEERWGFFMTGSGEFTHIGGLANGAGINLDTGGVTAGVDYRFTDHFAAGISLGYMNTTAGLPAGGGVDVHGGRIGAYATWFNGGLHFDAAVTGGFNGYHTRRTTPNSTAATASPEGSEVSFLFSAGRDWRWKGLTIGPTASVQYTNTHLDGFTERGPFAPLRVAAQDSESLRSSLGIRASFEKKVGRRIIRPEVRAAWQHEFGDVSHSLTSSFATLGGTPFTVTGPATGGDSLLLSAGFTVQWNARFATYAYYDGELARKNSRSNSVSVGFRYQF